ncbi:hypothetical protein ILUMI_22726, partial [Ignelater luminosus]
MLYRVSSLHYKKKLDRNGENNEDVEIPSKSEDEENNLILSDDDSCDMDANSMNAVEKQQVSVVTSE